MTEQDVASVAESAKDATNVREQYRHVLRDWPAHSGEGAPQKKGKRTIAIVGFAPNTRWLAPYDDPDVCILGMNEGYKQSYMNKRNGDPRYDTWIQIHADYDFNRENNESDPEHPRWLRQEHEMPIYMQEEFDYIPNAIKFPLEEIKERFVNGKLLRGIGNWTNDEEDVEYLTSTPADAIALALWYDFDRIELYGFNQATGTEYGHQKGSTEGWMHLAVGLGKQVYVPEKSMLVMGRLYGWEYAMHIGRQYLESNHRFLEQEVEDRKALLHNVAGARVELQRQAQAIKNQGTRTRLLKRVDDLGEEEHKAVIDWEVSKARADLCERYIKRIDNQFGGGKDELLEEVPEDVESG